MPDVSSPKWRYRDKLTAMNFANKGKGGFKQKKEDAVIPEQPHLKKELRVKKEPEEKLPRAKISMEKTVSEADCEKLYQIFKLPLVANAPRKSFPRKITPELMEGIRLPSVQQVKHYLEVKETLSALPPRTSDSRLSVSEDHKIGEKAPADIEKEHIISHSSLTNLIKANAKLANVEEAEKTFRLIGECGMKPALEDYNALMDAYSNAKDLTKTIDVFKTLRKEAHEPDVKSYAIAIKCLVHHKRLVDAFRLYEDLKSRNIAPTQPLLTTLIQGCSSVGDYNRAWRLFEHMRNEVCRPDELSFNLMIHICAKTSHTEKALSLYYDMLQSPSPYGDGKLQPIQSTFNCLIHACAQRPEFYNQTFTLVQQMENAGHSLDIVGYNYLLLACRRQGDIVRAKRLLQVMCQNGASGTSDNVTPNEQSYWELLECYSAVPQLINRLWHKTVLQAKRDRWERQCLEAKMGLANRDRLEQGLHPIELDQWMLDDQYEPETKVDPAGQRSNDELAELKKYVMEGSTEDTFLSRMRQEAVALFQTIRENIKPLVNTSTGENQSEEEENRKPLQMTTGLIDAYIDVLGAYGMKKEMFHVFHHLFNEYGLSRDAQTFANTLKWSFRKFPSYAKLETELDEVTNSKARATTMIPNDESEEVIDLLAEAWKIFEDYERFRHQMQFPERWQDLETKYIRNKYQARGITHKDRRLEYEIYKHMINGLTQFNEISKATFLLSVLMQRGHSLVANRSLVEPDCYSPTLSAVQRSNMASLRSSSISHPLHGSSEKVVHSPEYDPEACGDLSETSVNEETSRLHDEDLSITSTLSQVALDSMSKKQKKRVSSGSPSYVQPIMTFKYSDFIPLLNRATDLGQIDLRDRIQHMLNQGKSAVERQERASLERMQRTKRLVRSRWYGYRQS